MNVLDYLSSGADDSCAVPFEEDQQEPEDAPEISNKVVLVYNSVTSKLTIWYYYQYIQVSSTIGKDLLEAINHRNVVIAGNGVQTLTDSSTFFPRIYLLDVASFCHMDKVNAVNMINGVNSTFKVDQQDFLTYIIWVENILV